MTDTTSKPIDRRNLLRMGAGVSGAALIAGLPVLPAVSAPELPSAATQDPIIGYWAARNRLYAEARRVLDEVDILSAAGDERWREKERFADELRDRGDELEEIIAGLTPVSAEGWHIQCLILMSSFEMGQRADEADRIIAERLRDHFGNLAGVKSDSAALPPPAIAQASREELLIRYNCWLAYEHQRLAEEMYPSHPEPWRFIPVDRAAMRFHFPFGDDGRPCEGSSPSKRARAMLALAGVFTGPNAEFDPLTWKEDAARKGGAA